MGGFGGGHMGGFGGGGMARMGGEHFAHRGFYDDGVGCPYYTPNTLAYPCNY
jgi:hypothetical protein